MTDLLTEWGGASLQPTPIPDPPQDWRPAVRHLPPSNKAHLPPTLSSKVVGLSFEAGYPSNVLALADSVHKLRLHREPSNPYDANAVAVIAPDPDTGEITTLGHLPAALAGRLGPEIDAGAGWDLAGYEVLVMPAHPDRPGLSVVLCKPDARE